MTTDPVLAYAGPESRSIDVTAILYDGSAVNARGVVTNFETSAGEASAAFADAGPIAWIAFDGDPSQIEFVQYIEPATGRLLHRRVTKRERTSGTVQHVKLHIDAADVTTVMPAPLRRLRTHDFAALDFG